MKLLKADQNIINFLQINMKQNIDINYLYPCIKWIGSKSLQTKTIIPKIIEKNEKER